MELQSEHAPSEREGLLRACFAARESLGARGKLEGVPVPVEDPAASAAPTDRRDRKPADLALAVRAHRRAERRRDELRAEADAEHVLSLDRDEHIEVGERGSAAAP